MSVDICIEDTTLKESLLVCRYAYAQNLESLLVSRWSVDLPVRLLVPLTSVYQGEIGDPPEEHCPTAASFVDEIDLVLAAVRELELEHRPDASELDKRTLSVWSSERISSLRQHFRLNPSSRILVSLI